MPSISPTPPITPPRDAEPHPRPLSPVAHTSSTSTALITSTPSPSTLALLSLSQDITALISLSFEATASLINHYFRASLSSIGLGPRRQSIHSDSALRRVGKGESGRGLAVVVVNAGEVTGQSISLHLAKSGYTVFPLLPTSSASSYGGSSNAELTPLSSLLLTWSTTQKRLKARNPYHPGQIIPIVTDSEPNSPQSAYRHSHQSHRQYNHPQESFRTGQPQGRFSHAGETIRVYVRENGLKLVAVVCASKNSVNDEGWDDELSRGRSSRFGNNGGIGGQYGNNLTGGIGNNNGNNVWRGESPDTLMVEHYQPISPTIPTSSTFLSNHPHHTATSTSIVKQPIIPIKDGLLEVNESALISLYKANVLDPLSVIRELRDLLSDDDDETEEGERSGSGKGKGKGKGKGRVVFINGPFEDLSQGEESGRGLRGFKRRRMNEALQVVDAARKSTAKLLREELGKDGLDVCEVVVGPMSSKVGSPSYGLRQGSDDIPIGHQGMNNRFKQRRDDSTSTNYSYRTQSSLPDSTSQPSSSMIDENQIILQARLKLLLTLFSVDDALLYSSVRRAIEDKYPRYRHHAGLSPLLESIAEVVPGSGILKFVGRWFLGKLLTPRNTNTA